MQENDPANERRRKSAIYRNLLMLDNLPTFPARGMTLFEIQALLKKEEIKLSIRTIQRDLKMLSAWANLGYKDDDLGYRRWFRDLKKRNVLDILPTSEAFMLVLSEQLLRRVLPLHQSDKLEAWLNQANVALSSKHLYANWMKKVRVVSDNYPIIYDEQHIDEQYRKIIYESVLNEKVISISYQLSEVSDIKYYTLNPLGLIIREQSHYLVATKEESPEVPQLFLFHKIISVQKEYLGITKPKSFTLDEYYTKNPTGWLLEDTLTTVELKVKHYALDVVKHNKLSIDQQLEQIDETWWKVTFTCYPTYDLIGWILKFGQDVVCLSPTSLKQFVVKRLRATIENYE